MNFLVTILCWEVWLFLLSLAAVVVMGLFNGQINMKGLLHGKGKGSTEISPERVQLLLFTLGAAFQYVTQVLEHPNSFPQVPETWIALLGGSHLVYLGGKFGASRIQG
jgi:hypothetical protein